MPALLRRVNAEAACAAGKPKCQRRQGYEEQEEREEREEEEEEESQESEDVGDRKSKKKKGNGKELELEDVG